MSTDFRALCAELLKAVDDCDDYALTEGATVARARTALAESVGEGPTDEDPKLRDAALLALTTLEGWSNYDQWVWPISAMEQAKRGTTEALAALRMALSRFAPPAAGEVAELVEWLRRSAGCADESPMDLRAAYLLSIAYATGPELWEPIAQLPRQRHPAPVPVAERLQQLEDLAADAVSGLRYIEQTHGRLYGVGWDRVYEKADRLQPGHALPLPAGEVQP